MRSEKIMMLQKMAKLITIKQKVVFILIFVYLYGSTLAQLFYVFVFAYFAFFSLFLIIIIIIIIIII